MISTCHCVITDLVFINLLIGFSLITDMVVMNIDSDEVESNHEEKLNISQYRTADMQNLVNTILSKITITTVLNLLSFLTTHIAYS